MGIKDAIVLRIKELCSQKGIKYNTLATNSEKISASLS